MGNHTTLFFCYFCTMSEVENYKEHLDQEIFKVIRDCADELSVDTYVIGGYVRDLFLRRPSKDIDVVTVGSGIKLAKAVAAHYGKSAYLSVFKSYGTAQVKVGDLEVEFVGARKESYQRDSRNPIVEDGTLEEDLDRRDFTINAMGLSLNSATYGDLIDRFDGMYDLDDLIIVTPLDPDIPFSDDPLRMMRAVRFASQLGFEIEDDTFEAIKKNAERIDIISKERVLDELNKIILSPMPSIGFNLLDKSGLLKIIFPELHAMKGREVINGVGHKDNFKHTLEVLDRISRNTDKLWLRWAAVLHDIGKPKTKKFVPAQGWTFYAHNVVGSKMLPGIFKRMKMPLNDKMKYVQKLVELHMRPINISEDIVSDSAVRRLLFDAGDDIDDLMTLCEADITSKIEKKVILYMNNFKKVRAKLQLIEEKDAVRNFQPPVSGEAIMEYFNLTPCREVGLIKEAIKNAILDGVIANDYDEAFAFMIKQGEELNLVK